MIDWNAPTPLSTATVVLNLGIGLILALLVGWYYEHYGQSLANRRKLAGLLPVLTLTTALVISIVKTSLALSLGLVGALSIVRFRTAIKEPEELIFLFIAIAIGLGVGADQRWVTVIGVLVTLAYMMVRMTLQQRPPETNLYLDVLLREEDKQSLFHEVNACLLRHIEAINFRRLDSRDGTLQLTYFIDCGDPGVLDALIADLKSNFSVNEISFLQQERRLGG
ncbi:MAG: DUF4956 domain-containing protein [Chloroflexi bacterium]|jgi:hypothetical protein|nr:DUF4956 domain-containing protein [Chloroflexota bacterium]